jgi:eukaryotic-like serine/threonine-protein kinase
VIDLARWTEIERIVAHALSLPPDKRGEYLRSSCTDAALQRDVEAVLAAAPTATEAFARDIWSSAAAATVQLAEGDQVAHFRTLRKLNQGGLGTVYLAHDDYNADRKVALKLLPIAISAITHDRLSARFTTRSIVALYESGEIPSRFTYYAMEYVDGVPITDFCERNHLALKERLALFRRLCDAVEEVHDEDVAHRDLKPGNILVTTKGEVKLLDFGSARVLSGSSLSETADHFLSLPYASPEQLSGGTATAKTDVYSLGIILCLLLSGQIPHTAENDTALIDAIRFRKPEPPSRIALREVRMPENTTDFSLPSCTPPAMKRKTLSKLLSGDLDTIVLACLQRDPTHRPSLSVLSANIDAYLARRPISLRPSTLPYKYGRLLRRRWKPITSLAAAFLFLMASVVILFIERQEAVRQRQEAVNQRQVAIHQRDLATRETKRAETITTLLVEMFQLTNPHANLRGATTAKELLDNAVEELPRRLQNEPETEVRLFNDIGEMYQNMALPEEATRTHEHALDVAKKRLARNDPLIGETLFFLALLRRGEGQFAKGEALLQEALPIFQGGLPPDDQRIGDTIHQLGIAALEQGHYEKALALMRSALDFRRRQPHPNQEAIADSLNGLGSLLTQMHRPEEAEPILRECLALRERIYGDQNPIVADAFSNLAAILQQEAKFDEAERLQRRATSLFRSVLGPDHPRVAISTHNLGLLFMLKGDLRAAESLFREAVGIAESSPGLGKEHRDTIRLKTQLAVALVASHKFGESDRLIDEAYVFAGKHLAPTDRLMGAIVRARGLSLYEQRNYMGAERHLRRARDIFEALAGKDAYITESTDAELGSALVHLGRLHEAEPLLFRYNGIAVASDRPKSLERLAELYDAWGRPDVAMKYRHQRQQ